MHASACPPGVQGPRTRKNRANYALGPTAAPCTHTAHPFPVSYEEVYETIEDRTMHYIKLIDM